MMTQDKKIKVNATDFHDVGTAILQKLLPLNIPGYL